jgi:hypothetical protein
MNRPFTTIKKLPMRQPQNVVDERRRDLFVQILGEIAECFAELSRRSCERKLFTGPKPRSRDKDILNRRRKGETLASIGRCYGVSRQRIYAIVKAYKQEGK